MQMNSKNVIRFPALKQMLGGISRSTVFRWERDKKFPKHFSIGPNSVGWLLADIEHWISQRAMEGK